MAITSFPAVVKCNSTGRENHTVVADMDGTLLRGRSSFPYFALVAFEVGGILRLLFLLLLSPLAGILYYFVSESAGIKVLIFATYAGMKVSDIEMVARAVLPKFYSSDLHPESWRVFSACGKRCVLTANPRIMVEAFLKDFLGTDLVLGTEICTYKGRATGFARQPGILVGKNKADALKKAFGEAQPELGLGDRHTDYPFLELCKVGNFIITIIKIFLHRSPSMTARISYKPKCLSTITGSLLNPPDDILFKNVKYNMRTYELCFYKVKTIYIT